MILFNQTSNEDIKTNGIQNETELSQSQLCLLKLFSQFLDDRTRCKIEFLVKILELKQCIHIMNDINNGLYRSERPKPTIESIIKTLKEELPENELESINQLEEMMETMELYREMMTIKEE